MKNILKFAAIATAATIGLSASAKSLEAIKRESEVGKGPGATTETLVKDRFQAPAFMKGLTTNSKANVEAVLGTSIKNAMARDALIKGLDKQEPTAEAVWSLVAGLDKTVSEKIVKDLNAGVSLAIVAKANTPIALDASQKTECLTQAAFENDLLKGFSPAEVQMAKRDFSIAEADTGGHHILRQGSCQGGSNEYDLPARKNFVLKIFHDMVERHAYGQTSIAKAYQKVMGVVDWAKAWAVSLKFSNNCEITAPYPAGA